MSGERHLWLVLALLTSCADVANELDMRLSTVSVARDSGPGNGVPFDGGTTDGGARDGGAVADAGAGDAGTPDGGQAADAGATDGGPLDAGGLDGGVDGGPVCACGVWELCERDAGSVRCVPFHLDWLSPAVGVSAPGDLSVLPLGLDTNVPVELDVPWWSLGAVNAQGTFSGPPGIRSAQLLLPNSDGGQVTLFAGWDGGPIAQRSFGLGAPALQFGSMPLRGPNTADFEPNDPLGVAWRRDERVAVTVSDLPGPIAVFARAASSQQTWSTLAEPCDAGSCWEATLLLAEVDFPTFRGEVLVWVTGADGGLQTRPRSLPVTRWHWRRHIAGVPVPLRITEPRVPEWGARSFIVAGTEDTRTTGRLVTLSAGGQPVTRLRDTAHAVLDIGTFDGYWVVASVRTDAGLQIEDLEQPRARALPTSDGQMIATGEFSRGGVVVFWDGELLATSDSPLSSAAVPTAFPAACSGDAGFVEAIIENSVGFFTQGGPACFLNPLAASPPTFAVQTQRAYRPVFSLNSQGHRLIAAGADGGVFVVTEWGTMVERPLWSGALVNWLVEFEYVAFWTTADGSIWRYQEDGGVARFSDSLPRPARVSPVLLPGHGERQNLFEEEVGSFIAVDELNGVHAFKTDTGRRLWSLAAGDGGIRGGRVDSHPITTNRCDGLDTVLIPSAGDGSLYSFITDEKTPEMTARGWYAPRSRGWLMWNANPAGNQVRASTSNTYCLPE